MSNLRSIIKTVAPKADAMFIANLFPDVADGVLRQYGLGDAQPLARLLANMHHETMGFTKFVENMNYSAPRLMQVWPSRFKSLEAARPYANNPQALANNVYANRMGNGSAVSGDGWTYRGGGGLHHTGKAEYQRVEKTHGYLPDVIRNPANSIAILTAACSYCAARKVVPAMNEGDDEKVTRLINGGLIGHKDRLVLTRRYEAALNGWRLPQERTRTEIIQRDKTQAAGAAGASIAGVGTATIATPATPAKNDTDGAFWIGAGAAVLGALVIGFAIYKTVKAHRTQLEIDKERGFA